MRYGKSQSDQNHRIENDWTELVHPEVLVQRLAVERALKEPSYEGGVYMVPLLVQGRQDVPVVHVEDVLVGSL
jgi:hypothetical protein